MNPIKRFLQEQQIIDEVILNKYREVRFVLKDVKRLKVDDKKKSNWVDYYLDRQTRLRKFDDVSEHEGVFIIKSEPGSVKKDIQEIDQSTFESYLKGRKVELYISKRGVGVTGYNNIENGYVEKVIARTNKKVIFDEYQIEFEGLTSKKELEKLVNFYNPLKIFQMGLYDYAERLK